MFKDTNTFEKDAKNPVGFVKNIQLGYQSSLRKILERKVYHRLIGKKYLVPQDLSVGEFMFVIRKRIKLSPEKSIYLFIDGSLQNTAANLGKVYEDHKDKDGFLYILYYGESTFGN